MGQEALARAAEPSDPTGASSERPGEQRLAAQELGQRGWHVRKPLSWVLVRDSALHSSPSRWASRPTRHRGRQRVQRTPLGGPAGVHHPRAIHPEPLRGLPLRGLPGQHRPNISYFSLGEPPAWLPPRHDRLGHHQQAPGRSGTPTHGWGISDRIWFRDSDAKHPHRCRRKQLPRAGKPDCWFDGDFSV